MLFSIAARRLEQRDHIGSGLTAPWGLRGSPPQNNDDRPGELAPASEHGQLETGRGETCSDAGIRGAVDSSDTTPPGLTAPGSRSSANFRGPRCRFSGNGENWGTSRRTLATPHRWATGPLVGPVHFLERTFIIDDTPPAGVQFSHPLAEQTHSSAPVRQAAPGNLFREPEFAPGTPRPDAEEEPAPVPRQRDTRPRRTTRRRTAA